MKITVAEKAGFCSGVKKAVELALKEAENGHVYALGLLAHNEELIKLLGKKGIIFIDDLNAVPEGAAVIIRAHGERPEVFEEARKKSLKIIDATCPYVRRLQELAARLVREGRQVVIAGNPDHPEIRGVVGWAEDKPLVLQDAKEENLLNKLDKKKPVSVLAQTTQQVSILNEIVEKLKETVPAVDIYNTVCKATAMRQEAARKLAEMADVMIVIGSEKSSNTKKLAAVCRQTGTRTIQIATADELDTAQLQGVRTVGVTAGASTPDWLIKEVISKMENGNKSVELQGGEQTAEEKVAEEQTAEEQAVEEQHTEVQVEEEQPAEKQAAEEPAAEEQVAEEESAVEEAAEEQAAEEKPAEEQPMEQAVKSLSVGDIVRGTVVQVSDGEALIDIGYKSEGVLPRHEIILSADQPVSAVLQPGQEIDVLVKRIDDSEGKAVVSRRELQRRERWDELEKAFQEGEVLSGIVKETVNAGMVIDLKDGYEGFMPGSLVDIRYIPDFKEFLNQEVSFKIIEIRKEKEKLILSRKQVLEEEAERRKQEVLNSLQPGQIISGVVKRLTNFGAFVDVGGIDGLVHISEISWHRIEHPSEVLKVGDEIEVKVTEVIPERERIGLSLRQAQPDPWTQVDEKFSIGDIVEGKVTRTVDFGAFVELIPGVEGLVHISQLANYHVKQTTDVVQQGEVVKVKILDINTEAKRISLSIKEALPSPRQDSELQAQKPQDSGTGLTLGDVFGDLFNLNKKYIKEEEQ
ncbi:MAG: 30S ribosomal protein S1 [Bacillota bacterium]|nr:30S ribosomal protein S1 [Bacillota bacterium]